MKPAIPHCLPFTTFRGKKSERRCNPGVMVDIWQAVPIGSFAGRLFINTVVLDNPVTSGPILHVDKILTFKQAFRGYPDERIKSISAMQF